MTVDEIKDLYIIYKGNSFYLSRDMSDEVVNEFNKFKNDNLNKQMIEEWNNIILQKEVFENSNITKKIKQIYFLKNVIKEKELKLIIDDLENEKNNLSFFNTLIIICELIGNSVTNMHNGVIDFTFKTCNYKYTNKLIDILLYLIHAFVNQIAEDYDRTILPSLPPKQYIFDICSELKYKIKDTDLTEIDLLYKYCNE